MSEKLIAQNRKAWHLFNILEKFEGGLALTGTEVKSLRTGQVNLADSYARFEGNELLLLRMHIPPYSHGNIHNVDPYRNRKVLMHKRELIKIRQHLEQKGYTLVPLRLYFKRGLAKVELGLGSGKTHQDKRQDIKKREAKREMERYRR